VIFLGVFVVMPVLLFFGLRWMARRWLSNRPTLEATVEISPLRTYIAVAICLCSAVVGAVAIHQDPSHVSSIAFKVSCPWFLCGGWLAGDFSREGRKRFNMPLSAIYQDAKRRQLTRAPPLARAMCFGGGVMVLAGVLGWFL
jgi:hypothetical protein